MPAANADAAEPVGGGINWARGLAIAGVARAAKDSVTTEQDWVKRHEDQLRNVRRHKVVVLDGAHYLHWTQSKAMAQMITDFIRHK